MHKYSFVQKENKMKKIIALLMAITMVFALCACGSSKTEAASDNVIVVGTSADYAPFEFMYKDDSGNMVYGGIDVEVAKFVCQDMGKEAQFENMSFDYLLVALQKGDYDFVLAAMEDTEEREASADFSDPYYNDIPALILIKADKADEYKTLADFDGKTVGAQTATTKADMITELMPGANQQLLANVNDLINELVYDKVDAVILDGAVALAAIETNSDLATADASSELGEAAPYCIAVAKGDPKGLLPGINAAIAKITAAQVNEWVEAANALVDSGAAEEVSADAPEA